MALRRFAREGFDATTLSAVAGDAGITLAALYHYVEDKRALYEQVFLATLHATWDAIAERIERKESFSDQMAALVTAVETADRAPGSSGFLAAALVEVDRHPELRHLLAERERAQDRVLRSILAPLHEAGKLGGLGTLEDSIVAVRLLLLGWAMESHYRPQLREQFTKALLRLARPVDGLPAPRPSGRQATYNDVPRDPASRRARCPAAELEQVRLPGRSRDRGG
jgi:AcrR family transcriptional regulator